MSQLADRHALQVERDAFAKLTNALTGTSRLFHVELAFAARQGTDRRVKKLIDRPDQTGLNRLFNNALLFRCQCDAHGKSPVLIIAQAVYPSSLPSVSGGNSPSRTDAPDRVAPLSNETT